MDDSNSPETSRPPSVAQSDATEVPDFHQGPRTLASDIEHIKSLITRSSTSARPPENSITAQIFRSRSGSGGSDGQVSQQRLFHELDLLKRRIKHEQHHVRRPSQIDPETESESEDVPDEREEELENIRERLIQERQQSEDLLSAAETRVDSLSDEKDNLSTLLRLNKDELAKAEQLKADVDSALAESNEKIKALEENNRVAREEIQRLATEHKLREEESKRLFDELQERHEKLEAEATASKERIRELEEAANEHVSAKAELETLTKERDEHKAKYEVQRSQLQQELEATRQEHGQQLESLRAEHDTHIQTINDASAEANRNAQDRSTSNLQDLTTRLTMEQQENESLREQFKTKEDLHQEQVKNAESRITQMEQAIAEYEQRAANAEAFLKTKEEELGGEVAAKEHEIADIQREISELHKKLYDQSIELEERNAELSKAIEVAKENESVSSLQAELARTQKECDAANQGWADDIARFKTEQEVLRSELQEGWSSKAEKAARAHHAELSSAQDNFQKEYTELSSKSERRIADVNNAQANEIASLKEAFESEMAALKKDHRREVSRVRTVAEQELETALANADEDLDERLRAQSKAHRKELDKLHESLNIELTQLHVQLEEASQLRESQMQDAETEHCNALANLSAKAEAAEQTSSALQARLDAESMGRAEAERSLANFRKQRFEEDKTQSATKETLQRELIALEAERDALTKQLEVIPRSPQPATLDQVEGTPMPSDDAGGGTMLNDRPAATDVQRDEALALTEQKLSEISRQNEFLVKELERAMSERNTERARRNGHSDASVQTEPMYQGLDLPRFQEPKADIATSKAARLQRELSERNVQDVPETDDKRKSFEDYLNLAQAELSDRGIDVSSNEELFSDKIQEHMGELQSAKEILSVEYQGKLGAILAEKTRMERAVSAKNAADFRKAQRELLARYGIHDDDPAKQAAMFASLPSRKKRALRNTEETLVFEYDRRVTKRRSQIAVKHAEKFHLLTQDHNRRLAELVSGREKDDGEMPDFATRIERHSDNAATSSLILGTGTRGISQDNSQMSRAALNRTDRTQLEDALRAAADTTPGSRLPKRISPSKPRTPTSIPRAVPYRGGWATGDATAQSHKGSPAVEDPDTSQDSGSGDKTPSTQVAGESPNAEALASEFVDAFRRLSIEPNDSERDEQLREIRKQSLEAAKPQRSRPRAMRHSSRAIFALQQATEG